MKNNPIGIIDSGVGGLSIWERIGSQLPKESTIYLADSKNIPYGNKTPTQIYEYGRLMISFLLKKKVKAIVLACNTLTVCCLYKLRKDFPQVPIVGTVPVVKTAVEKTRSKKIGILSTENTAESEYQENLIKSFTDGCEVINLGTSKLVPFVERAETEGIELKKILNQELKSLKEAEVDTIALGCTHFPFLKNEMQKIMGENVIILDSADAIARQVKRVLGNNNALSEEQEVNHQFYTTGNSAQFSEVGSKLLNKNIKAEKIVLKGKFAGKKVAVIGFGIEGFSTAKFLINRGASVIILDKNEEKNFNSDLLKEAKKLSLNLIFGKDYLKKLDDFEVVVRSPGVKRDLEEVLSFEKNGGIVTSQTKIFFDFCPVPIIGVTGTKGKGTTSTLIYKMFKAQGYDAYLGGNIGNSPLDFLDKLTFKSLVVLELSSFQLMDLTKSPHIGVMLMTTSEHLDYHKTTEEYVQAKRNIFKFQTSEDFAVINRDYPASNESDIFTQGKVYRISRERETEEGCFVDGKKVSINKGGSMEEIINTKDILLPGVHNLENVCAATMVARIMKVQNKNIVEVLTSFKGLGHRLELVREVNGVKYYDDSFSTTPETAIAAIKSFNNPEVLILGGSSKGSDFCELGKVIAGSENIKAIIGIGKEWIRIKEQLKGIDSQILLVEGATDMKTILMASQKIVVPGDVVLLSPACASFGMFKNYKDRGNQFKEEVAKL